MKVNNLANLIAWILIILGVIFILWKLIGGSPTEFSILITLISGILFKIMAFSGSLMLWLLISKTILKINDSFFCTIQE